MTNAGVCFNGYVEGGPGCALSYGGSTQTDAGATITAVEVGFNVVNALPSGGTMTVDASSGAPGMAFSTAGLQINNNTTGPGCHPAAVSMSNSNQTITLTMPASCAASSGDSITLLLGSVTAPPTTGTYSLDVSTSTDYTPVSTNTFTVVSAPGAPTGLTNTPGVQSLGLSWTAPTSDGGSALTGFDVFCNNGTPPSTSGTPTTTTGATTTTASLTNLASGTWYCEVTAVNGIGQSAPSNDASGFVTAPPDPPTNVTLGQGDGSLAVSWTDPTGDGGSAILGYSVYCSTSNPPATGGTPSGSVSGATGATVIVSGLTNGTSYYCVVTATNAIGTSTPSAVASAVPQTVPGAPTGLATQTADTGLTLTWTDPVSDGGSAITGYAAFCSTSNPPNVFATPSATASGPTATSVSVTGLTNGTTYDCAVVAQNADGQSASSNVATGVPSIVPAPPTGVAAVPSNDSVVVSWTPPTDTGGLTITHYVANCTDGVNGFFVVTGGSATSATVTGLTNGTLYTCSVKAQNLDGTSVASSTATATPEPVPTAPTGLATTPGNGSLTLTWTDPTSNGGSPITAYDAYCSTASPPSTTGTPSATVSGASATSVTVAGLIGTLTYSCVVTAVNTNGASPASSVATGVPTTVAHCSSTGVGSPSNPAGYWLVGADGTVYSCGDAPFYGSFATNHATPSSPVVAIVPTATDSGYYLATAAGGVFAFGGATYHGSMGGTTLNAPIVGMALTSAGGYYLVASDGGIFAFGPGATFHGSMGGTPLNKPVVGMAVTPAGGYYEVAADGGVFAFGPGTPFLGSTGCIVLNRPIVGMGVSSDASSVGTATACDPAHTLPAGGYEFVASDGGVFTFGNARFAGSLGGLGVTDIVGMAEALPLF